MAIIPIGDEPFTDEDRQAMRIGRRWPRRRSTRRCGAGRGKAEFPQASEFEAAFGRKCVPELKLYPPAPNRHSVSRAEASMSLYCGPPLLHGGDSRGARIDPAPTRVRPLVSAFAVFVTWIW